MKNINPLSNSSLHEPTSIVLIQKILKGDKRALNELLKQHQDYIFNIALKVLNDIQDAEDVTQEVLVKIVSNLAKFDATKAMFTTWVYRIAFNHTLSFRKSKIEKDEITFPNFFEFIDSVASIELDKEEENIMGVSIDEARISCTAGMLMCLNREQRLTYIVGEIFKINHNLAADIFEISPANFRKKLSRARNDLHQWMHKKCGLVNIDNPCRCKSKTKKFIELGIVNPESYKWQSDYSIKINQLVEQNIDKAVMATDQIYAKIHQNVPFKKSVTAEEIFLEITQNKNFSKFIDPLLDR